MDFTKIINAENSLGFQKDYVSQVVSSGIYQERRYFIVKVEHFMPDIERTEEYYNIYITGFETEPWTKLSTTDAVNAYFDHNLPLDVSWIGRMGGLDNIIGFTTLFNYQNEEIYQLDAIQLTFKLMDYINYEDKDLD